MNGNLAHAAVFSHLCHFNNVDMLFIPAQAHFDSNRNTARLDDRLNDPFSIFGCTHQTASLTGGGDFMRRTAHVDVQSFEPPHGADFCSGAGHQIRFLAENLYIQARLIRMTLQQGYRRRMILWRIDISHGADHFRRCHFAALFIAKQTERPVCDARHGRQADACHPCFLPGNRAIRAMVLLYGTS